MPESNRKHWQKKLYEAAIRMGSQEISVPGESCPYPQHVVVLASVYDQVREAASELLMIGEPDDA